MFAKIQKHGSNLKPKGGIMSINTEQENIQRQEERLLIIQYAMNLFEKRLTQESAMEWDSVLSFYGNEEIRKGFDRYIKTNRRGSAPTPADILASIYNARRDAWLDADEIWPKCIEAMDESVTIHWPNNLCQKAFASVRPLLLKGDLTSAHWSFKKTYERLVDEAIQSQITPHEKVSLGWSDPRISADGNPEHTSFAGFISKLTNMQNSQEGLKRIKAVRDALNLVNTSARMDENARRKQAEREAFTTKRNQTLTTISGISAA